MNSIANNLALGGKPINDDELVPIIMNNLGPAFELIVNGVSRARARLFRIIGTNSSSLTGFPARQDYQQWNSYDQCNQQRKSPFLV